MAKKTLEEIFGTQNTSIQEDTSLNTGKRKTLDEIFGNNTMNTIVPESTPTTQTPTSKLQTAVDVTIGARKGVLSTVRGGSSLGEKIIKGIGRTITPKSLEARLGFAKTEKTNAEKVITQEMTTPTNKAQKVGFALEQISEFFLPATKVEKGVKALSTVFKGSKVGNLAARSLVEGAAAAGQTAIQEGKVDKTTLSTGAFTAVFSPVVRGLKQVTAKAPASLWKSILGRTPTMIEKNPNLEKEVAKLGITGTRKAILEQAQRNIQVTETVIDDVLNKTNGSISGAKVSTYLDDLKNSYSLIPGESSSVDAIEAIQKDLLGKTNMTLAEANNLKRGIYRLISNSYGKGTLEIPAKKEAQKIVASGLKKEIEKIVPEIKDVNSKQAIFLQLEKSMRKAVFKASQAKGIAGTGIGMYDLLLGGAAFGASGGDLETTAKVIAGKKLIESARVRTGAAKLINYFNSVSPTKKALIYNALKGVSITQGIKDPKEN